MTGGCVAIIGRTGRNFAAGMSGGVAYVHDADGSFPQRCNPEMVDLERVGSDTDEATLKRMLEAHARLTGSAVAERILRDWASTRTQFVKVMPRDYKHVLAAIERARQLGLSEDEAVMEAAHG
jgi:glutamate synthase domain-containing protein 3